MEIRNLVEVNPNDLMSAVYDAVGEGSPHVEQFKEQPGFAWRTWCQDRSRMIPLIRGPLIEYRNGLSEMEARQLRLTLQYLLNVDELVPYKTCRPFPELKEKSNGIGAKYFANYQDTLQPVDWYDLCIWMWEVLFGDEDWHENVDKWVITTKTTLHATWSMDPPQTSDRDQVPALSRFSSMLAWFRC